MTVVSCRCGGQFQASPELFGKQVACPNCGGSISVPLPTLQPIQPAKQPFSAAPRSPGVQQADFRSPPDPFAANSLPATQQQKRGGLSTGAIIACVGIGCVLVFVFGVSFVGYTVYQKVRGIVVGDNMELRDEDFATVHSSFRTELESKGRAPQDFDPLSTPAGAELIEYNSKRGNLRLKAYITPAPADGGEKQPAVVFLHGGFAYGESDWVMTRPFQDAGYVVMTPVLRAEKGQPGAFTLFHHEVDDVVGAINKLKSLTYVDSKRIYLTGHSAGGTLAALTAMKTGDLRAATSLCGCMNQSLNDDIAPYPASDLDEVAIRSPLAFAKSFKSPFRLFYGSEEFLLSGGNETTATRAKASGLDVVARSVPGDHFTSVPQAIQQTLQFFAQHGGPLSDYSPPTDSNSGRMATSPNRRIPQIKIPSEPAYNPPTFTPPTCTPPTHTPPTFTPPTIPQPPTISGRANPFGTRGGPTIPGRTGPTIPGRAGPSIPGRTGPTIPGRTGPSIPGRSGPSIPGRTGLPSIPGRTGPSFPSRNRPPNSGAGFGSGSSPDQGTSGPGGS
jgi:dienelactone hydrolase